MDKALIAFVIHEVPDIKAALGEIRRIIKPGGMFVLLEWEAVESEIGPSIEQKVPSITMKKLLEQNGFHPKLVHLNQSIYAIIAKNIKF
ncbi:MULTISPECIES: class I SAM-dependent methyltransferase [Bacillales]|uniref:class I SAM-dependent methyltransferase n=1 Tax=Bacillales TaxID=1385 RepID=UPI000F9FC1A0|nr:methyltransferase domain-containing protein [Bacillus sp. B1-b2]